MTRWVSVVGAFVIGAVVALGACSPSADVDVIGGRPAEPTDTTTATGSGDDTAAPDDSEPATTTPEPSTPGTVGPDVTTDTGTEPPPPGDTIPPDPSTGSDETGGGPSSSGTSPVDEADIDLIVELWAGYDDAVRAGVDEEVAYIAEHAYPGLELTPELCAEDPTAPGYVPAVAAELDPDTIEPDPDWVIRIPRSPVDGETPDGAIYVHDVTIRYEDGSADTAAAHTTVLDGVAYFFFDCGA